MFLLDNILLTVVVPIIPEYLFAKKTEINNNSTLLLKPVLFDEDNAALGILLASKAIVQLIFTPLLGYLTEIFDCKILMLIGSVTKFFAALIFAYGDSYDLLILARSLHGCSSAAVSISGMTLLAENLSKNQRTKLMPIAFGGIALGILIGYPLGGALYELLGKSAPFLIIAFFIFLCIILQIIQIKSHLKQDNLKFANINNIIQPQTYYKDWIILLNDKIILISGLAIFLSTSSMAILEPCIPIWLMGHMNPVPSKWQLGAVFIPDSIGYFIGSHFVGFLPVASWRIALSAMIIAGLSCYHLPSANLIEELILPHFGLGMGVGAVDASLVPLLANFVDNNGGGHYGPIYAFQQAFVALAYAIGPLFGGELVEIIGFPWLMRFTGMLNILFCPLLVEIEEKNHHHHRSPVSYSSLN